MKIEAFSQNLTVALSEKDLAEKSQRAAHLMADRDAKRIAFAEERKDWKNQITKMGLEVRGLMAEVREKVTYREVPCERRFLYAEGIVRDVRLDNGETLTERPMTEQESQRELFDGNPQAGAAGSSIDDDFSDDAAEE